MLAFAADRLLPDQMHADRLSAADPSNSSPWLLVLRGRQSGLGCDLAWAPPPAKVFWSWGGNPDRTRASATAALLVTPDLERFSDVSVAFGVTVVICQLLVSTPLPSLLMPRGPAGCNQRRSSRFQSSGS